MAEFFAEGFLHRLLGVDADGEMDDATKSMLDQYRLYIVPCMVSAVCSVSLSFFLSRNS